MTIALSVCGLLTGCASAWKPASGPYEDPNLGVSVDVPQGWYRVGGVPRASIILTKNGISLQAITIGRFDLDRKLPNTPARFVAGMSTEAAAQVDISNHQFAPGVEGFKLLDRGSADVDGEACYRYDYLYLDTSGQPRKVRNIGCIVSPYVYRFHYVAPAEKWFGESLPSFEAFVASVRFVRE